ncbi:MAG TPA: adenosylmethionine decarboxylase [Pirellulales bacterium]|nr:adenosylmethionine decarboxylase [Pirellulales bacterium]
MHAHSLKSWFCKLMAGVQGTAPAGYENTIVEGRIKGRAVAVTVRPREEHEFFGRHLLASYVGCDPLALADHRGLMKAFRGAVSASGATLLGELSHEFSPSGMTAIVLLSESHASIHTYPEHQACFVDLFTCGRICSAERFDAVLREHLRPHEARHRTVLRHGDGIDDASPASRDAWPAEWAA